MPSIAKFAFAVALAAFAAQTSNAAERWIPMFDGKSLAGWKKSPIPGAGEVEVKDGVLRLSSGRMTGVTWTGDFPRSNYEVRFEAARLEGNDFFASIVFPVNDTYCSWISGGWGGRVVGLSNLDGDDASENNTTSSHDFVQGRWYSFRLVVTPNRIQAWIDGSPAIDAEIAERNVSLRFDDTELLRPIGFVSYRTVGAVRSVEYRRLAPEAQGR
jgi:hypothetical protein